MFDGPATPADSFVEFISVQTHLNWRNTVWDQDAWRPLLGDLGVRYTRSVLGNRMARSHLIALHEEYGIRSSSTFNAVNDDGTFDLGKTEKILHFLRDEIGTDRIYAVEGPNEYTHRHKTGDWARRLTDYQKSLYDMVKSDSSMSSIDVLAPTVWNRVVEDYEAIGDLTSSVDYGNLHLYNAGRKPSVFNRDEADEPIDLAIQEAQIVAPGRPICVTETGCNVATGRPTKWTVPEEVAAKYTLRILAELFARRDRVKRVNIYSLIDDERTDDHYGLLATDLTPRPSYWALSRLLKLMADPGPEFSPNAFPGTIEAAHPDVHSLQFAKRDGRFILMLWQDAESYNRRATKAVDVPLQTVKLDFRGRTAASVKVYAPTISEAAVSTVEQIADMRVDVPDHVLALEITL
jgi:hypothetical protein